MKEDVQDIIASLNINKVLISILETVGEVKVPTLIFLENSITEKELVVDYDDETPAFVFKLKDKE